MTEQPQPPPKKPPVPRSPRLKGPMHVKKPPPRNDGNQGFRIKHKLLALG